ncbi:MAG: M48 family metallopeptidase [Nitrospinota bacterium]|nr:M48 family metallopeptidase [Nitrospinota bacterium]
MNVTKPVFTGNFYDGKSANSYPLKIFLTKTQLELVFPDERRILWPYTALRLSRTSSGGPVRLERIPPGKDIIPEFLIIEDPEFLHEAHRVAPGALGNVWNQPHKRRLRYLLMILACVTLPPLIFALWVYGIPAITNTVADHVPTEWEEKLGRDYYQALFEKSIKEPDPEVRKALEVITKRLLKTVPDQPYQFRIYVHPSKMVNALALPGGTIVVFQGLINITETPEELAGVLAHEFQHVLKRHSTRGIIRSEAINLLATIVSGDSMMNVIVQAGGMLEFLRFSRELESQADSEGMKMMLAARIDPQGMVRMFQAFEKEQQKQMDEMESESEDMEAEEEDLPPGEPEEEDPEDGSESNLDSELAEWLKYLSTHPAGEDRIETLQKMASQSTEKPVPLLPDFNWKTMHRETKETEFTF